MTGDDLAVILDVTGRRIAALPRAELADALKTYATGRLLDERHARAGGRSFTSTPWLAAARALMSAPAHVGAHSSTPGPLIGSTEWGRRWGFSPAQARRIAPRIGTKIAGRWLIAPDAAPPPPQRKRNP